MVIHSLELVNFRRFEGRNVVKFSPKLPTIIVGNNAAGKTTILDALAMLLTQTLSGAKNIKSKFHLQIADISLRQSSTSISFEFDIPEIPNLPQCKITERIDFAKGRSVVRNHSTQVWTQALKERIAGNPGSIPVICYYQTNRFFSWASKSRTSLSEGYPRYKSYDDAFSATVNVQSVVNWYLDQKNIQNAEKVSRKDLDYVLPTIASIDGGLKIFFSHFEGAEVQDIRVDKSKYTQEAVIVVRKGNDDFEFSQLSAGERLLIGTYLDIVFRMIVANPDSHNIRDTPGVVLFDEVELHLHPKWQVGVLEAFAKTFPNIQIIATTHSALVMNRIHSEQVVFLKSDGIVHGKKGNDTYGRDVSDIIEDFMGAGSRPKDVQRQIDFIYELMEKSLYFEAKSHLNRLKQTINEDDKEILRLDTALSFEEHEADNEAG